MGWGEELTALATARGPALVGYAYLLTGDRDAARDLVGEALVRVYGRTWGRATHLSAAPTTAPADIGHATLQRTGLGLPLRQIRAAARRRRIRFGAWVTVAAVAVISVLVLAAAACVVGLGADVTPDAVQTGARTDAHVVDLDAAVARGPSPVVGVVGTPKGDPVDDELVPWDEDTTFVTSQAPLFSCRVQDGLTRVEPGAFRVATLPATPLTGPVPECGAIVAPPLSGASDRQVAAHTTANARTWAPEGTPRSSVDATVTLVDTAEPGQPNREHTTGTPIAFLTRDGVTVGVATGGTSSAPLGARYTSPLPLVPGTTRQSATALLGLCPAVPRARARARRTGPPRSGRSRRSATARTSSPARGRSN